MNKKKVVKPQLEELKEDVGGIIKKIYKPKKKKKVSKWKRIKQYFRVKYNKSRLRYWMNQKIFFTPTYQNAKKMSKNFIVNMFMLGVQAVGLLFILNLFANFQFTWLNYVGCIATMMYVDEIPRFMGRFRRGY